MVVDACGGKEYNNAMSIQLGHGFKDQYINVIPDTILRELCGHPILNALHLTDVGFFPNARHHYRARPEGCAQHILIYCVHGTGYVRFGRGAPITVPKDTAFYIPPGAPHVYGSSDTDPWHIYWVHYSGTLAPWHKPPEAYTAGGVFRIPFHKLPLIMELFHTIFGALDQGMSLGTMIHCSQVLGHLLSLVYVSNSGFTAAELCAGHDINRALYQVERAISFLQNKMSGSCTLDEVAKEVGLSKSQLTAVFKRTTGYSPIAFFINLKMQLACRYLDLTDMNISEIAAAIGYQDPYYFSRVFSKTIGMSPSAYKHMDKG